MVKYKMIKFDKLFILLKDRGIGQNKFCSENDISTSQLERLRTNKNVNTYTLNKILDALDLDSIEDIATYIKDK